MIRRVLPWLLLLTACGDPEKPPEVIQRELPTDKVKPIIAEAPYQDPLAQGGGLLDAGCCTVSFALSSSEPELSARIVFPHQQYPMDRDDGGIWRGVACLDPRPEVFYFQVGLLADDDAGILYVDRVNEALPVDTSGGFAPAVNRFEGADGGVCAGIDAARYVTLPDAG